jgi:23S rRNA (guanosine2251-2'-O)-methyltransferase
MKKTYKKIQTNNKNFFKNKNFSKQKKDSNNSDLITIGGKNPCFLALKNPKRIIHKIYINKSNHPLILDFLNKNKITHLIEKISIVENTFFNDLFSKDFVHQSIAVIATKINNGNEFELLSLLNDIEEKSLLPNLLILDQITDPHNVGAIIRSAIAFDFKNIILCNFNSAKESSSLVKASAGNIEFANIYIATNLNNLIEKLKKIGYWCVGLDGEGKDDLDKITDIKNIALIAGSEGSGIRHLVKKNCDFLVRINTNKMVESLNVSVATAIALNSIYSNKLNYKN